MRNTFPAERSMSVEMRGRSYTVVLGYTHGSMVNETTRVKDYVKRSKGSAHTQLLLLL